MAPQRKKFIVNYPYPESTSWCKPEWIGKVFEFEEESGNTGWRGPMEHNVNYSWHEDWLIPLEEPTEPIELAIQNAISMMKGDK